MADERKNRPIADVAVATQRDTVVAQSAAPELSDELRAKLAGYPTLDSLTILFPVHERVTNDQIDLVKHWLSMHAGERIDQNDSRTWGDVRKTVDTYLDEGAEANTVTRTGGLRSLLERYKSAQKNRRLEAAGLQKSPEERRNEAILLFNFNARFPNFTFMAELTSGLSVFPKDMVVDPSGATAERVLTTVSWLANNWPRLSMTEGQGLFTRPQKRKPEELRKIVQSRTGLTDQRLVDKITGLLESKPKK